MTRLVRNTESKDQFTDGPCHIRTVGNKNQTQELLFFIPVTRNIHTFTGKKILLWQISYSFCHISYSCDMGISSQVSGIVLPIKISCVTLRFPGNILPCFKIMWLKHRKYKKLFSKILDSQYVCKMFWSWKFKKLFCQTKPSLPDIP